MIIVYLWDKRLYLMNSLLQTGYMEHQHSTNLCVCVCMYVCVWELGQPKVMTNLDSIFKSRGITLPTKVCLVKAMVFPVVMYGCESWTVKKAER